MTDEPRGAELIERYRSTYNLREDDRLTTEVIRRHWQIEQDVAHSLLESTVDNRWEMFEKGYSKIFGEIAWHDELAKDSSGGGGERTEHHESWVELIGEPSQRIFEIGSGQGELLKMLADAGHHCRGTEITRERGKKYQRDRILNLSWAVTDGVNLDHFEEPGTYDVVMSNQVIEHLHPDDLATHLRASRELLVPGGRYILSTPHRATGPHDISAVFGYHEPRGVHLREYTYRGLSKALREAGFDAVAAVNLVKFRSQLSRVRVTSPDDFVRLGRYYLRVQQRLEVAISRVGNRSRQRAFAKRLRNANLFTDNIFLVAKAE